MKYFKAETTSKNGLSGRPLEDHHTCLSAKKVGEMFDIIGAFLGDFGSGVFSICDTFWVKIHNLLSVK